MAEENISTELSEQQCCTPSESTATINLLEDATDGIKKSINNTLLDLEDVYRKKIIFLQKKL